MYKLIKKLRITLIALTAFILTFSQYSVAKVIETNNFTVIKKHLLSTRDDTLVVFDIDDVLLTVEDQILQSTHKKYNNKLAKEIESRISKEDAQELWSIILLTFKSRIMHPKIPSTIKKMQDNKIKVVALTNLMTGTLGKITSLEEWTINRLSQQNINLTSSWKKLNKFTFKNIEPAINGKPPSYREGVIFASGVKKGKVLEKFIKIANIKPNKIIFIDNRIKHIKSVEEFCKKNNINFVGFHFTANNKESGKLNIERANRQFYLLEKTKKWYSDKEINIHKHKD